MGTVALYSATVPIKKSVSFLLPPSRSLALSLVSSLFLLFCRFLSSRLSALRLGCRILWLIRVIFHSCVRHDSFICAMTHSCVPWPIHVCYDSFMYAMTHSSVPWLIHLCHDSFRWYASHLHESCLTHEWILSHVRMCHVSLMNELCHIWTSHVSDVKQALEWVMSPHTNESCLTRNTNTGMNYVIRMSHVPHAHQELEWIMSHMNESCFTRKTGTRIAGSDSSRRCGISCHSRSAGARSLHIHVYIYYTYIHVCMFHIQT